jgi:hypothetical protein
MLIKLAVIIDCAIALPTANCTLRKNDVVALVLAEVAYKLGDASVP